MFLREITSSLSLCLNFNCCFSTPVAFSSSHLRDVNPDSVGALIIHATNSCQFVTRRFQGDHLSRKTAILRGIAYTRARLERLHRGSSVRGTPTLNTVHFLPHRSCPASYGCVHGRLSMYGDGLVRMIIFRAPFTAWLNTSRTGRSGVRISRSAREDIYYNELRSVTDTG